MTSYLAPQARATSLHDTGDDVDIDSGSSVTLLRSVGQIIAALRRQAGLTQAELGERIGYGEEMVSKVERGIRIPRPEFLDNTARALGDRAGVLAALKDELARARYSDFLHRVHQEEAHATAVHAYDTHVVNALLQTEGYMRAVLGMHTPPLAEGEIDRRVTTRLERQQVIHRDRPPVMSFVMDESLLRRPYGGRSVLRDQLHHLAQLGQLPHVDLQVMPLDQDHHAGIAGPFTLMDTQKHTRNAYVEAHGMRIHTERDRVRDLDATYSRIRAQALSPRDTQDFIEQLLLKH